METLWGIAVVAVPTTVLNGLLFDGAYAWIFTPERVVLKLLTTSFVGARLRIAGGSLRLGGVASGVMFLEKISVCALAVGGVLPRGALTVNAMPPPANGTRAPQVPKNPRMR